MIKTIKGDILTEVSEGFIVQQCNTLGVTGGFAQYVRNKYPKAFEVYSKSHRTMGSITIAEVEPHKFIVNGIGQKNVGVGRQTSYDALVEVFEKVVAQQQYYKREFGKDLPICFPLIGAGLGGGSWPIIEKIIDETVPDSIEKVLYVLE